MPLSCRFYSDRYPEVDDVVMVNVRSIEEMGAYVHLLEYNNIEGMILLSELSRRRIRSINKLIRIGKTEPVVVIRVDKEKGYIDLSKRRVSQEDVDKCTERYSKAKAVNSILRHVAELMGFETDYDLEKLYLQTAWSYEDRTKKKASAYEFFKQSVIDPSLLDECNLSENAKELLLSNIKQKLTSQAVKIRSDIEVACYGYEGIDAVKAALKSGLACSTEEIPIKINLIAPPIYVMTTATPEKTEGVKALQSACDVIKKTIEEFDGVFQIKMAPKVVTATDEADLARQLERAEAENAEIAGDEDEEQEAEYEGDGHMNGEESEHDEKDE